MYSACARQNFARCSAVPTVGVYAGALVSRLHRRDGTLRDLACDIGAVVAARCHAGASGFSLAALPNRKAKGFGGLTYLGG